MTRLATLRGADPVLTTIARGYSNAEFIADALFPFCPVPKEAGTFMQFGKEAFKLYNTLRAIRAASNRMNPEGMTPIAFATNEHDLEYPIDYRESAEAMFNLQKHATVTVQDIIMLQMEYAAAVLAQTAANYPTGNKITLSGTSQFTDKTNSDPIGVVDDAKEAIRQKIGRYPNTMIMGASAFKSVKEHPDCVDKIKYSQKGVVTVDILKEIFDIETLKVGKAVYADDDGTFSDVWSDNITLAWVPKQQSGIDHNPYAPSFGYTFRRTGYPFVDRYEEKKKVEVVRDTDNYSVQMVGSDAGYLISDTNA